MPTTLVEFLIQLATNPKLHNDLDETVLINQGITNPNERAAILEKVLINHDITNPDERQALLNKDADALKQLLGGSMAMLNNNGTVYTLNGTVTVKPGKAEPGVTEFIIQKSSSYDLELDAPHKKYRARFISGKLRAEETEEQLRYDDE